MNLRGLKISFCPFCGSNITNGYFCKSCNKSFQILTESGRIHTDLIKRINWAEDTSEFQKEIVLEILSDMILIHGGTFVMGVEDIASKSHGASYEISMQCPHLVELSDYYLGRFLVTQRQWFAFMPFHPCEHIGSEYPIDSISWNDCVKFCKILKEISGIDFSLPTEAQWFFAAMEGNEYNDNLYSGSSILDEVAWTKNNSC